MQALSFFIFIVVEMKLEKLKGQEYTNPCIHLAVKVMPSQSWKTASHTVRGDLGKQAAVFFSLRTGLDKDAYRSRCHPLLYEK